MFLVGWVWIMIMAFAESVPWGVVIFCFSPIALVFGILHWDEAKVPTILFAAGLALHLLGRAIG
jgi:hypothetical protein